MYELLHKHNRIAQIILALIMVPFAFFGVDYYFKRSDASGEVAKFDGGHISEQEFARAIRDQQDMLRRNTQQNVDPSIFDNPEVRFNLLQQLLREHLIEKKADDLHFRISNEEVFERIASDPGCRQCAQISLDV